MERVEFLDPRRPQLIAGRLDVAPACAHRVVAHHAVRNDGAQHDIIRSLRGLSQNGAGAVGRRLLEGSDRGLAGRREQESEEAQPRCVFRHRQWGPLRDVPPDLFRSGVSVANFAATRKSVGSD